MILKSEPCHFEFQPMVQADDTRCQRLHYMHGCLHAPYLVLACILPVLIHECSGTQQLMLLLGQAFFSHLIHTDNSTDIYNQCRHSWLLITDEVNHT
jgi:hypothetical protein